MATHSHSLAAAADVEGDAHHGEAQVCRSLEQPGRLSRVAAVLEAQGAARLCLYGQAKRRCVGGSAALTSRAPRGVMQQQWCHGTPHRSQGTGLTPIRTSGSSQRTRSTSWMPG
jgi:hypothetical protein